MSFLSEKITTKSLLLFISFLSGSCGLAYEVLYSRILSSFLGSMFYVSGSILFSFLFGLGLGSLLERKIGSKLKYLELFIGVYAFFVALLFESKGMAVAAFAADLASYHPFLLSLFCILFLLPPAILIGVCVPAFSHRAALVSKKPEGSFSLVYAFYNLGAAAIVLFIEFYLIRNIKITSSLKILALINLAVFLMLHVSKIKHLYQKEYKTFELSKEIFALFTLCFISGIFQILFLKISYSLWGPLNENFAIIISVSTFCIFISSLFSSKLKISFHALLYVSSLLLLLPFIFTEEIISVYSYVLYFYGEAYNIEFLIKYAAIFIVSFLPMIAFGAALPVFKTSYSKVSVGYLMAVSSFGNAFGYLVTMLFLHEHFHETTLFIICTLLLLFLYMLLSSLKPLKTIILSGLSVFLLICFWVKWPYADLAVGYRLLMNPSQLKIQRSWKGAEYREFKKYDSSVAITDFKNGSRILSLNGYVSLRFFSDRVGLKEMVSGLMPSLFSKNSDNALVFGLGSGLTAGAVAQVYQSTEVVEINPAILKVVEEFSAENLGVMNKAQIYIQDGIIRLLNSNKKYDVILNTSTSPYYFSSNKLWSKEILQIISDKLEKGGVYTSWIDLHLGQKGFTVLDNTLKSVFKDCVYLYLSSTYFSYTCSNEKLSLKPEFVFSQKIQNVFKKHIHEMGVHSFLKNLLVSEKFIPRLPNDKRLNSLNFPALEYTFKAFADDMTYFLRENLKKSAMIDPLNGEKLSHKAYHQKCKAWSILGNDIWTHICTHEH